MYAGALFVVSAVYLTFIVSFVVTVLERGVAAGAMGKVLHRWGKFLLLLTGLGVFVMILTALL